MKIFKRLLAILKDKGFGYAIKVLSNRFSRFINSIRRRRVKQYSFIKKFFLAKSGIEIGGPSPIFRNDGFLPLYKIVTNLDGCNFSNKTLWEKDIKSGETYNFYDNKYGIQFISEATDLGLIPNEKYDFVISSNCLEHVANPLKALREWIRVLRNNGILLLILPNKDYCFDHKRPVTKFRHLLDDFQNDVKENDLTHLNEILELHDLEMDKPAGTFEQFKERSSKNFENRTLHHHIFDISLLKEIYDYFNIEVLMTYEGKDYIIVGKKNFN